MFTRHTKAKSIFYQEPAFRYRTFVCNTILVLLDLLLFAATLLRRWTNLSPLVVFLLTIGMLCLLQVWFIALTRQRYLYGLLEAGGLEKPVPCSGLDVVLGIASDITDWGLLAASISVGALLEAVGEMSRFK